MHCVAHFLAEFSEFDVRELNTMPLDSCGSRENLWYERHTLREGVNKCDQAFSRVFGSIRIKFDTGGIYSIWCPQNLPG